MKMLLTVLEHFHTDESIKERVKCYFNPFFKDGCTREK